MKSDCQPAAASHGIPRRTLVYILAQATIFLSNNSFVTLTNECMKLAHEAEEAVSKKIEAKGMPAITVPFIRHKLYYAQTLTTLMSKSTEIDSDANILSRSINVANTCRLSGTEFEDMVNGELLFAQSQYRAMNFDHSIDSNEVLMSYFTAYHMILHDELKRYHHIPLRDFIIIGKILVQATRFQDVITVLSQAISVYPSSSTLYLLLGIAYLRLDLYPKAETCLQHANVLDNRNPDVWSYYCLLCLSDRSSNNPNTDQTALKGPIRLEEANKCLNQAIRLKLSNGSLLRELSVAYISIDKLAIAEDLIRRAMSVEIHASSNQRSHPATRKLFADILAGQNQATAAIAEYQQILADDGQDVGSMNSFDQMQFKIETAEKCLSLLDNLGLHEDATSVREIIQSLKEQKMQIEAYRASQSRPASRPSTSTSKRNGSAAAPTVSVQ